LTLNEEDGPLPARLATDAEIETWNEQGWVVLEGLVGTEEIDDALDDIHQLFPTNEEYHSDPDGTVRKWKGSLRSTEGDEIWPENGPGFRDNQHLWVTEFPFPGAGVLNRLCVHPSVVNFAERALGTPDIRLYQTLATAAYSGLTNYEQPMHIDRNHSWLPAVTDPPWRNIEGFLYLSDVKADDNPTRVVSHDDAAHVSEWTPILMPDTDPKLYGAEHRATGIRGSYLAYSSDIFHRGAPFGAADRARFLLTLGFKRAGQDWIGYNQAQSNSTDAEWTRFVEHSAPRELELFGFPPPGHLIWNETLLDRTAIRYPRLDLSPWREALGVTASS
jgi:hypothetical protein